MERSDRLKMQYAVLFYRDQEKYRKGFEEGRKVGREERYRKEIAKSLIDSGVSIEVVVNSTGFSEAEILKLKSDE